MDRRDVRAKKHLGQHFLKETAYCERIADALQPIKNKLILEVGPGTGALTHFLLEGDLRVVEIDTESVAYLRSALPQLRSAIIEEDYLSLDLQTVFEGASFSLCGNFPYNISSQIVFHALDHMERVDEICGMFQREMARRIAAPHGNKEYGILSVLTQAFYDVTYLFDVPPTAFVPPPKVTSGVIHALKKKNEETEHIPRKELKRVVKLAFNQRRKTLKNALKTLQLDEQLLQMDIAGLRAEQLSVPAFIELAQRLKDKEL